MTNPSLELHSTLQQLLRSLVPEVVDFAFVHFLAGDEGVHGAEGIREVAVAHRDPAQERRLVRLLRRIRPEITGPRSLVRRVIESGQVERADGPTLRRTVEHLATDGVTREDLREFLPRAYLVLPLDADGRVLGTLSLGRTETDRPFSDGEVVLLSALARQGAWAIRTALRLEEVERDGDREPTGDPYWVAGAADIVIERLKDLKDESLIRIVELSETDARRGFFEDLVRRVDDLLWILVRVVEGSRRCQVGQAPVPLNGLVRAAIERVGQRVEAQGVELDVELDPTLGETEGHEDSLIQGLVELLENALDAMPNGGRLQVVTEKEGRTLHEGQSEGERARGAFGRVHVHDSGSGMTEETVERAFEPFFTRKDPGEHPGLGLARVHGMAKLRGGRLLLSSGPGEGTEAVLFLPLLPGGRGGRGVEQHQIATVLLVEDHSGERVEAARHLEEAGFRVLVRVDESEAVGLWRKTGARLDALVLDADLGGRRAGTRGLTLVEQVRMIRPGVPVIYTSRAPGMERALLQVSRDNTHFVGKPFSGPRLVETLKRVLAGSAER